MGDPSASYYCLRDVKKQPNVAHEDPELNSLIEFFEAAENNVFESIKRFQALIHEWKAIANKFRETNKPVHEDKLPAVDTEEIEKWKLLAKLFELDRQILEKINSHQSGSD